MFFIDSLINDGDGDILIKEIKNGVETLKGRLKPNEFINDLAFKYQNGTNQSFKIESSTPYRIYYHFE